MWYLLKTWRCQILMTVLYCFLAESIGIVFSFYIRFLLAFLLDPTAPSYMGYVHSVVFTCLTFTSEIFRNIFMLYSQKNGLILSKSLYALVYQKLTKVS